MSTPEPKYGRLQLLRRKALALQAEFLDKLSSDPEEFESPLEKAYNFFLWEIDEALRAENRKK